MAKQARFSDIPCPECKEPIAFDAKVCAHCSHRFSDDELKARKTTQRHTVVGCLALALILVLGFAFWNMGDSVPDAPEATAKVDAARFIADLAKTGRDCDQAIDRVADGLSASDAVQLYRLVDAAEARCLEVSTKMDAVAVPTSVGRVAHAALTAARATCADAFIAKWSSMKSFKEVAGGDQRVSAAALAQTEAENAGAQTTRCVVAVTAPLMELGLSAEEIAAAFGSAT